MIRQLQIGISIACLGLVFARPAPAADRVKTKADPAKPVSGTILLESPNGIKIRVAGDTKQISASDILDVVYDFTSAVVKIDFYNPAINADEAIARASNRKKALGTALDKYDTLLAKLTDKKLDHVRRNVEYRIASLTIQLAQEEGKSLARGIQKLKDFRKANGDGWQIVPAVQLLAQLLVDAGKFDEAEQEYKDLATNAKLPEEARDTFRLLAAQVSIRPGKYADASAKLQDLIDKFPKESKQSLRARISQAECLAGLKKSAEARARLDALLAEAKADKELRAQAYNTLGLTYYNDKQYKDALYEFLRVDVLYYQNRDEHAKALYYLADLFKKLKDLDRANECRDKLKNSEFAGTYYQGRLLKEEGAKGK